MPTVLHLLTASCSLTGESTTMALIAERFGLIADLRSYAGADRPIWGTCAGLIFLANRATGSVCHNAKYCACIGYTPVVTVVIILRLTEYVWLHAPGACHTVCKLLPARSSSKEGIYMHTFSIACSL